MRVTPKISKTLLKPLDLKRFQTGGVPSLPIQPVQALDPNTEATNYYNQYLQSPEYLSRLSNFFTNPQETQKDRFNNFSTVTTDTRPMTQADAVVGDTIPEGFYNLTDHKIVIDPAKDSTPLRVHELSHSATMGDLWLSPDEVKFIGDHTKVSGKYSTDFAKYLHDPTEYQARLNVTRQFAKSRGHIKGNENVTEDVLNRIIKDETMPQEVYDQLEELLNTTKGKGLDDKIKNLKAVWNTLGDNSKPQSVPIAQLGGTVNPIYVTDPNDPRYQAYQDSLHSYNVGRGVAANIGNILNEQNNNTSYTRSTLGFYENNNQHPSYGNRAAGTDPSGYGAQYIAMANNSTGRDVPYDLRIGQQLNRLNNLPVVPQYDINQAEIPTISVYKKPVQPVILDQSIDKLPPLSINQLSAERPLPEIRIKNGLWEDGRLTQDWEGVPGLQIISAKSKKNGRLEPIQIQNSAGEKIDYKKYKDKPLPKGFQYPQYAEGGQPMRTTPKKSKKPTMADLNKKFQLGGGIPGIPQNLADAFKNTDFNNYDSIVAAGSKLGGANFDQSFAADNPDLYSNGIMKGFAQQNANITNPLFNTPELVNKEVERRFTEAGGNDIKDKFARKNLHAIFEKEVNKTAKYNQQFGNQMATDINYGTSQAQSAQNSNLFNLLDMFHFSEGGSPQGGINPADMHEVIQRVGYSDGSPFMQLPQIQINSSLIDMSRTGVPIKATPNKGKAKVLQPYSGVHEFKGAKTVTETIHMAKGGKTPKKYDYMQSGGIPDGAIGAQLEVGELFATPNAEIMDTTALVKHKDMKKDVVTDVLGMGDYVFSAMDKMKMTRKEAEDMSFGLGGVMYVEGQTATPPVENLASDLFKDGETEVNLADYVDRIRKKYKVGKDEQNSVFDKKTNAANKESRIPYITAAAAINEKKKKGEKSAGYASTFENMFNTSVTADANPVRADNMYAAFSKETPAEAPRGQLGGLGIALQALPAIGGIFHGFGQLGAAKNNKRDTLRTLLGDRGDINTLANTQSQYSGLGTALSLAGVLGLDPTVNAYNYDTTQLDNTVRRTPSNMFEFQSQGLAAASKPYLDQLFKNGQSFGESANAFAPTAAANAGAIAGLGLQQVNQDIQLENNYRNAKQVYLDAQMKSNVDAGNATRTNSNNLTAQGAGIASAGIQGQGQIQSDRINALRNNNFQQTQNIINWRKAKSDAWGNIIGSASKGISNIAADIQYNDIYKDQQRQPQGVVTQLPSLPISPVTPFTPFQSPTVPPPSSFGYTLPPGWTIDPATGFPVQIH